MHINGKKVGFNKGFNIKPTVKTYTKANKMLIEVLQMSASAVRLNVVDVDDPHYTEFVIKSVEDEDKLMEDGIKFLVDLFKLNEKQVEHLEESIPDSNVLANYLSYVIRRIKGQSDEEIALEDKKASATQKESDPKKQLVIAYKQLMMSITILKTLPTWRNGCFKMVVFYRHRLKMKIFVICSELLRLGIVKTDHYLHMRLMPN